MNRPDYNSPSALKKLLDENGMAMQKKFGQNFMVNPAARKRIIDELSPSEGEAVWEIGPGLGCMTEDILKRGANLTVFEIDRGFIGMLREFFSDYAKKNTFRIVEGDVLKTWKKQLQESERPVKLSGNLPYSIAATFIADTITGGLVFDRCVFTVQKEVAQRMAAAPGTENYSSFSVLCQWGYDVRCGIELAPGNFWPRPNVASQSVIMTKKAVPYECKDPKMFTKLVHALFASRRKTIANNIKAVLPKGMDSEPLFAAAGVKGSDRAENLSAQDFIRLSDTVASAIIDSRSAE